MLRPRFRDRQALPEPDWSIAFVRRYLLVAFQCPPHAVWLSRSRFWRLQQRVAVPQTESCEFPAYDYVNLQLPGGLSHNGLTNRSRASLIRDIAGAMSSPKGC